MAELTQKERLQPSLLDRLTDDEPPTQQESREKRVLSMHKLRLFVLRDISWLLNRLRRYSTGIIINLKESRSIYLMILQ